MADEKQIAFFALALVLEKGENNIPKATFSSLSSNMPDEFIIAKLRAYLTDLESKYLQKYKGG